MSDMIQVMEKRGADVPAMAVAMAAAIAATPGVAVAGMPAPGVAIPGPAISGGAPARVNRRRHERTRTFQVATVNYGHLLLPCFVLDVSEGGAKIKMLEPTALAAGPLVLECGRFGKVPGQVAWQRGQFAGIKFAEGQGPRNIIRLCA